MVSAADAGRVRLNDQAVRPVGRTALEELDFHWQMRQPAVASNRAVNVALAPCSASALR